MLMLSSQRSMQDAASASGKLATLEGQNAAAGIAGACPSKCERKCCAVTGVAGLPFCALWPSGAVLPCLQWLRMLALAWLCQLLEWQT